MCILFFISRPASKSVFNLTVWSIGFQVRGHSFFDSYSFHTPSVIISVNPLLSILVVSFNLNFTVKSKNIPSHEKIQIWGMSAQMERNQRKKYWWKHYKWCVISFRHCKGSKQEVGQCHADITRISTFSIIRSCPLRWIPIIPQFIQLAVWCFVSDKKLSESVR